MEVATRVKADLTAAMKSGEKGRVTALRLVLSELQKAVKDGDADELAVLRRERKRRLDAASQFRDAGREELADQEQSEAELIAGYLPAELGDDELLALVRDAVAEASPAGPQDMGRVMSVLMPRIDGRADGRRVSEAVRAEIAGRT